MKTVTWLKAAVAGGIMCVGGPALVYYVMPSEEELFLKYSPELQRRSLERRKETQEDFDSFVARLKLYSKGDKNIWHAWEQEVARKRAEGVTAELDRRRAAEARKQEIKDSLK